MIQGLKYPASRMLAKGVVHHTLEVCQSITLHAGGMHCKMEANAKRTVTICKVIPIPRLQTFKSGMDRSNRTIICCLSLCRYVEEINLLCFAGRRSFGSILQNPDHREQACRSKQQKRSNDRLWFRHRSCHNPGIPASPRNCPDLLPFCWWWRSYAINEL